VPTSGLYDQWIGGCLMTLTFDRFNSREIDPMLQMIAIGFQNSMLKEHSQFEDIRQIDDCSSSLLYHNPAARPSGE